MLIVFAIAAAASLAVVAYTKLREHSPEAGSAGLRSVRELAAIVLVCSKAIEGVVDVLAGTQRIQGAAPASAWADRGSYDRGYDYEDEP
ncbi:MULTISPECIES: hypothetical protein [unclassified Knoellia]|uniref:hypothetical protein n=1 Tax=Knoellia altitudinis TaxID=3404795 RepID=UPI00360ED45C